MESSENKARELAATRAAGQSVSADDMAQSAVRRLREVEERFRLFMENVKEYAVLMLDPEGRVTDWNFGVEHLLGYGPEILGQPFSVFFPPDDVAEGLPERELRRAAETGQASDDRWHVRKNGTYFWALGVTTAMRDEHGTLKGFTKVLRDRTERKRFEEQLEQSNKALQDADRRKDEFLAMLAHELRNPLAPITNALSMLEQQDAPPDIQREAVTLIGRQVRAIVRLVDDLLDVSRITRGKVPLRTGIVQLQNIVTQAVEASRPLIDARRHALTVSMAPNPIYIDGDEVRLEQVIVNLLNNAAKYSHEGASICIGVDEEDGRAVLRVKDSGIGIAPAALPHIFDMFFQGDRSLERAQGGLGIGLTLVRSIVDLHGGSVKAISEGLGQGSEFIVTLPLSSARLEVVGPLAPSIQSTHAPLRLLIVDDNVDAAQSLKMLLTLAGHDVITAYSGVEGINAAAAYKPDVVLLDIGLPGLNGYQVAEGLRESAGAKNAVLIAVTGYAQEDDRQRAMRAGFDHHLVKPVDTQVLEQLLGVIGKRKAATKRE